MLRALCLSMAAIGLAAQGLTGDPPKITARTLKKDGAIVRGSGQVKIAFGELVLEGREGSVNSRIDEMSVEGGATARLPRRTENLLVRYSSHVLMAALPLVLKADRITMKDGLLRARGHVHVEANERKLDGDELDCFLNIGDGTLTGNIRENGTAVGIGSRGRKDFPPDVIK